MPALTLARIEALLGPYFPTPSSSLLEQLSLYLDLLVKWNARTNLSAIRNPEDIVVRHFGESLFAARHLPAGKTLLDLGSGAGFPGLPIALSHPEIAVTLAESQNKKASFLREAIRTLGLKVEVHAGRAETMAAERRFDLVTMRAVDLPERAMEEARRRVADGGAVIHLTTGSADNEETYAIPGSEGRVVQVIRF